MANCLLNYKDKDTFFEYSSNLLNNDGSIRVTSVGGNYFWKNDSKVTYDDGDIIYVNENGKLRRVYEAKSRSLDVMMTTHCNSNCLMCPLSEVARQSNETGYYEWLMRFLDALPGTIEHVCITGGEPTLLKSRLIDVIYKLRKKVPSAQFQFLTNGRSCCSFDLCKLIVEALPTTTLFGIPLHAGNKETYDAIVQVPGGFEQVDQGIKNLIKCGARVEIRVVVSKLNADRMDELADYIIKNYKGAYCVTFMGLEMMGNSIKNLVNVWMEYSDATKSIENAIEMLIKNSYDVMLYNYPLCNMDKRFWTLARRSITEYKVRYYEQCNKCDVKEACSGFFQSTFNVMKPKIYPVEK